jgi:arylsulfatase A-like enzyme
MPQPNFIFILTDDQGYGDVSRHGNPILKTPHMDLLHEQSVKFEDFCVSPSCSPSRCALMTGRHEFRSGVTHTIKGRNRMSLKSSTLAERLKKCGYQTGLFGKWHLGHEGAYRPEQRGFDHSLTTVEDTQHSHFDPVMLENGKEVQKKGYRTDILFDHALDFIKNSSDSPFFCYIPTYSPHQPLAAPENYLDLYRGKVSEKEAAFFAMLSCIDDNIGRLMSKLTELRLDENTLVILMNDNGATCGVDLWNANMRGCKGTTWFGGTRALSFWRWKGTFQPKSITGLASHMDLLPTLVELADGNLEETLQEELDGISLVPQLRGEQTLPERFLFTHQGRWPTGEAHLHQYAQCGVRWNQYHLVRNDVCENPDCEGECRIFRRSMSGAEKVAYSVKKGQFHYALNQGQWSLFDTHKDPAQEDDLSQIFPDIVREMAKNYTQWWDDLLPDLEKVS